MTFNRSSILRTGELFTIDVDAEIRKLGDKRLKSDGESALELVQLASNMRPKSIEIELQRQRLNIHCKGGVFDDKIASVLMTVMNPQANPIERHEAVVALEDLGGLALLGAFVLPKYRVTLEWTSADGPVGLRFIEGVSTTRYEPTEQLDFQMEICSPRKNLRAEMSLIKTRCRFASMPITLDGKPISFGRSLSNCLLEREIENGGITGLVGVPLKGDLVNLVTTRSGIVSSQTVLSFPSGLALDAVLENKNASARRQAEILEEHGKELYGELAARYETFGSSKKKRIKELLFEYCLQTDDQSHVSTIRVFDQAKGPVLNLDEVLALVRQKKIYAIDEEESVVDYEPGGRSVLVLGELERRFVEKFVKANLPVPPPRIKHNGFRLRPAVTMRAFISKLLPDFPKTPGRPIPSIELGDEELSFLVAMRSHLQKNPSVNFHMTSGQKSLVAHFEDSQGEMTYYVSRSHPRLQQMVRAFSQDDSYIYPSLQLLIF